MATIYTLFAFTLLIESILTVRDSIWRMEIVVDKNIAHRS